MADKKPTRVFRIKYVAHCEVFRCRNRAAWAVGKPGDPVTTLYHLCEPCAMSLFENQPEELKPKPVEQVEMVAVKLSAETQPEGNRFEHRCEECGKVFDKEQALKMHKIRMHME